MVDWHLGSQTQTKKTQLHISPVSHI